MEASKRKRVEQEVENDDDGIVRWFRDFPPADYTLKIESFSLFLETKVENYESRIFEAGGRKWKLLLCPQGNSKRGVNDHISLYLKLVASEEHPPGFEINAHFKFFVLDQIRNKFLTIQDAEYFRRFNEFKSVWGFDKLVPLYTFKDVASGYLMDDCCVFGAEIFVLKYRRKGECFSTVKLQEKNTYTWTIKNFSATEAENIYSDEFVVGDQKWKLQCYPRGNGTGKGTHMSLFLSKSQFNSNNASALENQVYADFKLTIKDQINGKHDEYTASTWFTASKKSWGHQQFLSLNDLNNKSKGYIMNDTVIVEGEVTIISSSKHY